jgi:hypothetical protein
VCDQLYRLLILAFKRAQKFPLFSLSQQVLSSRRSLDLNVLNLLKKNAAQRKIFWRVPGYLYSGYWFKLVDVSFFSNEERDGDWKMDD